MEREPRAGQPGSDVARLIRLVRLAAAGFNRAPAMTKQMITAGQPKALQINIEIDITNKFNVITDWSGNHTLNTVIDIDLTRHPGSNLRFSLENFAVNIDEQMISAMSAVDEIASASDWSTEGFLFIDRAAFTLFNIKGADGLLRRMQNTAFNDEFYLLWDYELSPGDRILAFDAALKQLLNIILSMKIISPNPKVIMQCNNIEYVENILRLKEKTACSENPGPLFTSQKGKLFDLEFINNHLSFNSKGDIIADHTHQSGV